MVLAFVTFFGEEWIEFGLVFFGDCYLHQLTNLKGDTESVMQASEMIFIKRSTVVFHKAGK